MNILRTIPMNSPSIYGSSVRPRRPGLTLIEITIVVIVIGVLAAILLPAIGSVRESGRRTTCMNQMRQLGLGLQKYGRHNALMFILPYLELDYISDKIDLTKNWNEGANEDIAKQHVYLFLCPSAPYRDPADDHDATDYTVAYKIDEGLLYNDLKGIGYGVDLAAIEDEDERDTIEDNERAALEQGLLGVDTFNTHSQISDGLGNTFMMVERAGLPYKYQDGKHVGSYTSRMRWAPYTTPFSITDMYYNPTEGGGMETGWKIMNRKNSQEIYSFHPGGAVFLYGDGAAKFESESMSPVTFANLFTRDGGEVEFRD
jgi:prepilin-type N-terminal cleavage/methylation domain-containing protein